MKLIAKEDIDQKLWDQRIAESEVENIFCYYWYLLSVADDWMAVVTDDYKTIVPLPFTTKLGVKQMYQAPFTREYSIIGNEFEWKDVLALISEKIKGVNFRTGEKNVLEKSSERRHQFIQLDEDWRSRYRTNAKRMLKKANAQFSISIGEDPGKLLELFVDNVADKIESIGKKDLVKITALMFLAKNMNRGEVLEVSRNGEVVAAGFFLKDKQRITYLKGASFEHSKKEGAMYFLIDQAMERYQGEFNVFDFGGSDVENVANFYKKFGALERTYYNFNIDNLPSWFKTLKRIKK